VCVEERYGYKQVGGVFILFLAYGSLMTQIAIGQAQGPNTSPVLEQRLASQTAKELTREFPNIRVQRDAEFRIIKQLSGRVTIPGAVTPSEVAQLFLSEYKKEFTNTPEFDEFRLIHEAKSLTGTSLTFTRLHAGFPVIDDLLSMFIDKEMTIIQINNNFTPVRKPLQTDALPVTKAHAIQTALTDFAELQNPVEQPAAVLSVAVLDELPVAVWKVTFKTRKPAASWQILVNAKSDQVIAKRNVALYSSK
jgi:Zn-dependent metalloprotease